MVWQQTPYTLSLLLTGAALLVFGGYLFWTRRRESRGARLAVAILLLAGGYVLAHAAQQAAGTLVLSRRLRYVEYLGALSLPPVWLAYVLWYTRRREYLTRRLFAAIAVVALAILLALVTTPIHGLYWTTTEMLDVGSHRVLVTPPGPLFWGFLLYTYGLHVVATALLGHVVVQSKGTIRYQSAALLVVGIVPALLGLWFPSRPEPFPGLNLAAMSTAFTAVVAAASLRWANWLDLDPVPRDRAFDAIREAVVSLSPDDRVVDYNDAAARLFVGDHDDPVGEPLATTLPGLADELADAPPGERREFALDTASGERVFEATVAGPDATASGAGDGEDVPATGRHDDGSRLVVLHDVTERARERERLDEFASVVSHDLRNPLGVAAGRLQLARDTGDLDHLDAVARAHDRMDDLVDDVLALAREGRTVDETAPVDLAAVARSAWRDLPAEDADLAVPDDAAPILADRGRLAQLLGNLFRNAVEHAGPDVAVRVEATPDGFAVIDDGPGIDPDHRERVFDGGFSTGSGGTGLGLAIVHRIAGAHGWSVAVDEGESGGARFEVSGVEWVEE